MKIKIIFVSMAMITFGLHSCQKDMTKSISSSKYASKMSLSTSTVAASIEVATSQVSSASTSDIHSISLVKFDGTDPLVNLKGLQPPRDHHGRFLYFGHDLMRFDIPKISSCAIVTVSDSVYPKQITIDYGSGCSSGHGSVKKGEIIINITDTLITAGSSKTVTTDSFYIDSIAVDYSSTISNLGKNSEGYWVIVSTFTQKITKPDGSTVSNGGTDTAEWINGFETVNKSDDIFYESGSGSITFNDTTFSRVITKPLLHDTCQFIVSGTIELLKNDSIVAIIDYGTGDCDNKATVTINGTTEEINLYSARFHEGSEFDRHCHGRGFGGKGRGRYGF
jgi:hypothetical protein